jgi:uncharacterized membrane protein YuzA (DUF378 family)
MSRILNLTTLALIIVGGLNWLLGRATRIRPGSRTFGVGSALTRLVYVLVCLSAIWQLVPLFSAVNTGEVSAERG